MTATTIYVVKAFGGSYDDAWETNVCAFLDEEQAKAEVARLDAEAIRLTALAKVAHLAYYPALLAEQRSMELVPVAPRGPAKGTPETREMYRLATVKHQAKVAEIGKRNQAKLLAAYNMAMGVARAKVAEQGGTEEDMVRLGYKFDQPHPHMTTDLDARHTYEELELQ